MNPARVRTRVLNNARRSVLRASLGLAATALSPVARAATKLERWPANRPTPALNLPRLDGGRFSLGDASGRVVLLNFWASWCQPCIEELPALERLATREADRGLLLLTINFRQGERSVSRFLERHGFALPVLLDTDGAAANAWGARILPTSIVIDRSGNAALVAVGDPDWTGEAVRTALRPLW